MSVAWVRNLGGGLNFTRPSTYLCYGTRGAGKSSLLETIGEQYLRNGLKVLDLFGSRDGEGLAWCRSPWVKNKKILLLHGDNSRVSSDFDSKPIGKWTLEDLEKYDITISSSPLYSSPDQEYRDINRVIDLSYKRRTFKLSSDICFITIREAANLLYSRLKVCPDQIQAKSLTTFFLREARHSGFALGLDTLKLTSIDLDVRSQVDYLFLKALGHIGLPDDLNWIYSMIRPFYLQSTPKGEFVVVNSAGSVGLGVFPEVPWHKREGEDILRSCEIEVEHDEETVSTKPKSRVGDFDHAHFIERRLAGEKIEAIAGVEWSQPTVWRHFGAHNEDINRLGECTLCSRAKSPNKGTVVQTGRY